LRAAGLPPQAEAQLLELQFRAQQAGYARDYPEAGHRIVELDGVPSGRVWVDERGDEVIVVDLALLPERRGAGIGSLLLREIVAEASASGRPVRMTSLKSNPRAIAVADRLGFSVVEVDEVFVSLVHAPE
jgi:GNAT superfamily N-acetyltransferase